MALTLSTTGIADGQVITAAQVTQSIDALTGTVAYDITISGSLTLTGSVDSQNGFTGSLKGIATTSSKTLQAEISSSNSSNQFLVTFVADNVSGYPRYSGLLVDSGSDFSGLRYQPSTNALSASLFIGTASFANTATNVVNVGTPNSIYGSSYSASVPVPNTIFKFIAGSDKTGTSPNTVSININELTGKTLGADCFVTATISGSGVNSIVVNNLLGSILTFESQVGNASFHYHIMYI